MNKINGIHFWPQDLEAWITRYNHEQQKWPVQKYRLISPASRRRLKNVLHHYSVRGLINGVMLDIGNDEGWVVFMSITYYDAGQSDAENS